MTERKKKIRILYMTWGEVIARNGIFRNQVIEQVMLTSGSSDDFELSLMSGVPLVNMKLLRSPRAFLRELAGFREKLAKAQITFTCRFLPVVSSWFYSKRWQFPLYRLFNTSYLKRYVTRNEIDIVHCRSYHAAYFALRTRERYHLRYKVIFDTRGLFPEEGIVKKSYLPGDKNFAYCKEVEQYCLDRADVVVNVSSTFTSYIHTLTQNRQVHTIYTSTNLKLFHRDEKLRSDARQALGIDASATVLTYLGDVRNSGWHQAENLARLYKAFSDLFPQTYLLVITEQDHAGLLANMSTLGVDREFLRIGAGSGQARINELLNAADYACLPFRDVENDVDKLLGYTMIASKTGEYLATGLPVLSNAGVGAASELVRNEQLGVVYKDDGKGIRFEHMDWTNGGVIDAMKCRAVETARRLFDAGGNARKYGEIYRTLACSPS